MKHLYFMALVVVIASAYAARAEEAKEPAANTAWYSCEKDKDCGRTETLCGEPQAVNLEHYHDYKDFLKELSTANCKPPRKVINLRELKSVCRGGQCTFDPAPNFGG